MIAFPYTQRLPEAETMKEKLQMWVAWRLPRWLVRWAAIRMIAHATTGRYSSTVVPELPAMTALERWDR